MPAISTWKLRRLSSRALRVFERRKATEPAIAAFEPTLLPVADAFMEAYDKARAHRMSRAQAMGTGKGAIGELLRKMRAWTGLLARDVTAFQRGEYGDSPKVPDDVIHDAQNLVRVVRNRADEGAPLSYQDGLIADLEPAIAAAQAEWGTAGTSSSTQSELLEEARKAADAFNTELIAFRRVLRALIGSSHPDYQKLRSARVTSPDADDDEVAASLPDEQEAQLEPPADDDEPTDDTLAATG